MRQAPLVRRLLPPGVIALVALSFAGGFADLYRGGITLSAVLLVFAYVVAVPAMVLYGGRGDRS